MLHDACRQRGRLEPCPLHVGHGEGEEAAEDGGGDERGDGDEGPGGQDVRQGEASRGLQHEPDAPDDRQEAEGVATARQLVQPVEGGDLGGVLAGGEVAAHVEERGAVVRVERDDAGDTEEQGEEAVADLEHVRVATEQRGGDHPDGEARQDGDPDDVDAALADELQDDPAHGEAAGDDQRLGVGVHVLTDDEVDPDRQRRAEDQAGQVLADGRDPGLPGGTRRGHGRRPLGAPRGLRFHDPRVPPEIPASSA